MTSDIPQKKTDRRILRTRNALVTALTELIEEKDYTEISVDEITQRADIGRATFYLHFKDKDDLLLEKFNELVSKRVEELSQISLDFSKSDLAGETQRPLFPSPPLLGVFEYIVENQKIFRIQLNSANALNMSEKIGTIILNSIMQVFQSIEKNNPEHLQFNLPIEFVSAYFSGALLSSVKWWMLENKMQLTPLEMTRMFQPMFFPGLRKVLGL
jgi:AcrR family transcriptional regulator